MKRLTCSLVLVFLCIHACPRLAWAYSGGTGTPSNPYQIATVADWQQFMNGNWWYRYYILTADIDLQGITVTPIGNSSQGFCGEFNGNGHVIRNVTINMPASTHVGLFGDFWDGAITNLGVESISVTGGYATGGLVGAVMGGDVTNCYTNGSVQGTSSGVGGLIGGIWAGSNSTVSFCHSEASVSGTYDIGGLIGGDAGNSQISNCHASGSVACSNNGGGLLATATGDVSSCYATGSVTGTAGLGGLIGLAPGGSVTNCYATGSVTGTSFRGGLIALNSGDVLNCYSVGAVSSGTNNGGLIAHNDGTVTASFWNTQTSGLTYSDGGIGKGTVVMKYQVTYESVGWDFSTIDGDAADWRIWEQHSYPELIWQVQYGGGSGTFLDPYHISQIAHWVALMSTSPDWNKAFILTADLDMQDVPLTPVGDPNLYFTGWFDGTGHVIRNATIDKPESHCVGLFGCVGAGGMVRGLGMEQAQMTGYVRVGCLVGHNAGRVSDCYATGTATGDFAGVLVGYNDSGTISDCYAALVPGGTGYYCVGGLVGYNLLGRITGSCAIGMMGTAPYASCIGGLAGASSGIISRCYSQVELHGAHGSELLGGLVGYDISGTITGCYATGPIACDSESGLIGGLVGGSTGTILSCYSTSSITCDANSSYVGGLVGDSMATIADCYATGAVTGGASDIGGLVGIAETGRIEDCYSTGLVSGASAVGGLIGTSTALVSASFWDTDTSQNMNSADGIGLPTSQMKTYSTFASLGWDFTNEMDNGADDFWRMCTDGGDYPTLSWQAGTGDLVCPDGVAGGDLACLSSGWLMDDCVAANNFCGGKDADRDGDVDMVDFALLAEKWLQGL